MKFEASSNGKDSLNLADHLQRFAGEYWLPEHVSDERGAEIILDAFKRKVGLSQKKGPVRPVPFSVPLAYVSTYLKRFYHQKTLAKRVEKAIVF